MRPLVEPHISSLKPYEPGKPVSEVERELGHPEGFCVKLASNENPLGPSPRAIEAVRGALDGGHFYPDGGGFYLRRKLAERFGVGPETTLLGNGSNEIIEHLVRAFMPPGTKGISSGGSFVIYKLVTLGAGRRFEESPLGPDKGYDLDALAALVDEDTRIVWLANPNNPTGTIFGDAELADFLSEVDRRAGDDRPLVVLDHAYEEYVDLDTYPRGLEWVSRRDRTVYMRTFSKAYGLAGLRCGYALASEEIATHVNRIRAPFNVNSLSLVAAEAALDDHDHIARTVAGNAAGKAHLQPELERRGLAVVPTWTNFFLVDTHRSGREVFEELLREGIITRPMGGYGLPTCLRITIGTEADNQRLLDALDAIGFRAI